MHSVLLVVDCPLGDSHTETWQRGNFLADIAKTLERYPEIETLAKNVWLIPLHNGIHSFSSLVCFAQDRGYTHRAVFFQEPPKWVASRL